MRTEPDQVLPAIRTVLTDGSFASYIKTDRGKKEKYSLLSLIFTCFPAVRELLIFPPGWPGGGRSLIW